MDTGSNDGMALRATLESCEVGDFDLQLLSECSHAVGFKSDYRVGKPRLNAGQRNSTNREALPIAPRPLACWAKFAALQRHEECPSASGICDHAMDNPPL